MSAFAVAAFHEPALPAGAAELEALVWIRAAGLGSPGVDVWLRLWTPAGARVTALREVEPGSGDLLPSAERLDDRTLRVATGRWTDGVREYELAVGLPVRSPGDQMLAARVGVVAGDELAGTALIAVTWSEAAPAASGGSGVAPGELPTGASPEPRHTPAGEGEAGGPCPDCGEVPHDGDRFCEACGRELAAG